MTSLFTGSNQCYHVDTFLTKRRLDIYGRDVCGSHRLVSRITGSVVFPYSKHASWALETSSVYEPVGQVYSETGCDVKVRSIVRDHFSRKEIRG